MPLSGVMMSGEMSFMNNPLKTCFALLFVLALAGGLSACGDTWDGIKKDTGDNMEAAGETLNDAGEKVKN